MNKDRFLKEVAAGPIIDIRTNYEKLSHILFEHVYKMVRLSVWSAEITLSNQIEKADIAELRDLAVQFEQEFNVIGIKYSVNLVVTNKRTVVINLKE